jgi:hypothetical protein
MLFWTLFTFAMVVALILCLVILWTRTPPDWMDDTD